MVARSYEVNGCRVGVRYCLALISAAAAVALLGGCGVFGTPAETPEQLVRRFYNTFGQDPNAVLDMLSDDVQWILPDSPVDSEGNPEIQWLGTWHGPSGVQQFWSLVSAQVQMQEFTPREFYPVGNTVLVVLHEHSTCTATGIDYTIDFIHRIEVNNNRITLLQNYLNIGPIVAAFRGDNSYNQGSVATGLPDPDQVLAEYGFSGSEAL